VTSDIEFLAEVNEALTGAQLDALVLVKFSGSLELSTSDRRYRIDWGGWLSTTPSPTLGVDAEGFQFAPIVGPMIGRQLLGITKDSNIYRLEFSEDGLLFAGHWPGPMRDDHVLLVTNIGQDSPFTWGILD
jgi:hypothetical protein